MFNKKIKAALFRKAQRDPGSELKLVGDAKGHENFNPYAAAICIKLLLAWVNTFTLYISTATLIYMTGITTGRISMNHVNVSALDVGTLDMPEPHRARRELVDQEKFESSKVRKRNVPHETSSYTNMLSVKQ